MTVQDGTAPLERKSAPARPESPSRQFPFPAPDFDPLQATPEELARYGLPREPDPGIQPNLRTAWLRLFERPVTFRPPKPVDYPTHGPLVLDTIAVQDSHNWSGASIVPNGGRQFVLLFGEWTVPCPYVPAASPGSASGSRPYRCTTWIGLDGNRRYRNASLPQIGTEQIVAMKPDGDVARDYRVWFEWWDRNELKINRLRLAGLEIEPGRSVMAMIWAIDPQQVVTVFRTFAPRNEITILVQRSPEVCLGGKQPGKVRPTISGATAEWIVERPQHQGVLEPFAGFTPVGFRHCVAGMAPAPGPATSERTMAGCRIIRMFEAAADPRPFTRFLSMPKTVDDTSMAVKYAAGALAEG